MNLIKKLLLPLIVFLLAACGNKENSTLPEYQTMDDLNGKPVAALTGAYQEALIEKQYPEIKVLRIDNVPDAVQALISRRCEAVVVDDYALHFYAEEVKDMAFIENPFEDVLAAFCFNKDTGTELLNQFNDYLKSIKQNGLYDEIYDRWMRNGHNAEMPDIPAPTQGEPLRVVTCATSPPISFIKNNSFVGFEIELTLRFATHIGRPIIRSDMNFLGMIPALISGTQDIIVGGVNITEDRKDYIAFSDPTFTSGTAIAIRKENAANKADGQGYTENHLWDSIKHSFHTTIMEEKRYILLWEGFKLTILISLFSSLLGTILGGIICWMRMNRNAILRQIANIFIAIMRGTPILVLLMLMFYVVFANTSVNAIMVSIITFAMNFAAYVSEMFRSSILSIDKGQTEAGIAIGFTPAKTFYHIILPQAFKQVLPVYKGELISMVKMTSIVGYIAVQDLTKVGDIIRSRTFDAFFPLLLIAALYFIISWMFAMALDFIGRKTA